jgi:hypothetical protein
MGNLLSGTYTITRYYIHWFTDRDNINLILETNDKLYEGFNLSLTYEQCMRLYDILETVKTPKMTIERNLVGRLMIVILNENKSVAVFLLE